MQDRVERNLRLYPAYAAAFASHFWLPVFFLYFQSRFSLADVLRLEAIYYFTVVVMEVPSGYFSDVVGRRITLIIAALSTTLAHALFCLSDAFSLFAMAQVLLAIGIAFNSGTNTALHFDSLKRLNREKEYDRREARVAQGTFIGSGFAALTGGLSGAIDLRFAYLLSLVCGVVALVLALRMVEPNVHDPGQRMSARDFLAQTRRALGELRQPALAWLSAYGVLMIVLNHLPYEFYQPYLDTLLADGGWTVSAPPVSGVVTLITMVIAAQIAATSIRIRDRIGLGPTLLLGTALQTAIIAGMALVVHPIVVALILLRSCPRAIMTAPRNAAVTPRVHQKHRATFLSLESLAGRLAFSCLLWALSGIGDGYGFGAILYAATVVAAMSFAGLAATAGLLKK